MNNGEIILCECSSVEHQIVVIKDEDIIYCQIHLVGQGFWSRLKLGIKYIFGYRCKYGNWDEFILTRADLDRLNNMIEGIE